MADAHGGEVKQGPNTIGSLVADAGVPKVCPTKIGCAVNVPWLAWEEGWQALQVID